MSQPIAGNGGGSVGSNPVVDRHATNYDGQVHGPATFALAVLAKLGITPSTANVRNLVGWENIEGGHWNNQAHYNPLNTTQDEPGAGNTGSQGNIKQYKDWNQGIDATVKTLKYSRYAGVLSALKNNAGPDQFEKAVNPTGWNPGGYNGSLASAIKSVNPKDLLIKDIFDPNYNDPVDPTHTPGKVKDAVTSPFKLAQEIWGKISDPYFWLNVGKVILGMVAIVLGVVYIGKQFNVSALKP